MQTIFSLAFLAAIMYAAGTLTNTALALWHGGYLKALPNLVLVGGATFTSYQAQGAEIALVAAFASSAAVVLSGLARRESKSLATYCRDKLTSLIQ